MYRDVALILGGASCLWTDVDAVLALAGLPPYSTDRVEWPGIVIATNDAGAAWPGPVDHWVTLHPEKLCIWEDLRRVRGYPEGYATWSRVNHPAVDNLMAAWGSTSGLLAVTVAAAVVAKRAVLCGVPMGYTDPEREPQGHFFDRRPWLNAENAWRGWEANLYRMRGWVRSASEPGTRTRDALGGPTAAWLRGEGD